MHGAVTVTMHAPADRIWALLSDVTRIGELSPETLEAEWLDGAKGPRVGALFRGHVRRNGRPPMYWTTCRVTECTPNEVFEFAVLVRKQAVNTWRYELRPNGAATDVTESFRLADTRGVRLYWRLAGRWRARTNERNMRATLERAKAIVGAAG